MRTASCDDALIAALYGSVTRDDAFMMALSLLAKRFRCPSSTLFYMDRARPEADVALGYGLFDEAAQRRYAESFAHIDPAPSAMARLKPGSALSTDDEFGTRMHEYSHFLNEFYHPLGLAGAMGGPIAVRDGRSGIVAVHRGHDRAVFARAEVLAFERFMPHLAQALELRRAFFSMEVKAQGLAEIVEVSPVGILVFGAEGTLHHANAAARRILDGRDALLLDRLGRLRAVDAAADQKLCAYFRTAGVTAKPLDLRVERSGREQTYAVRIRRHATDEPTPGGFLVALSDPMHPIADVAPVLRTVFGMTLGSAHLAAALVQGETLQDYAAERRLSLNTAKFHLKGAFERTKTSRQSELVRVLATVLRDLGS